MAQVLAVPAERPLLVSCDHPPYRCTLPSRAHFATLEGLTDQPLTITVSYGTLSNSFTLLPKKTPTLDRSWLQGALSIAADGPFRISIRTSRWS